MKPAASLPKPGVEAQPRPAGEREAKPYDADEVRAIWNATSALSPAWRALYRLGHIRGQRPGEISRVAQNEIKGSWWTIPSRTRKEQDAPSGVSH
jgi:hypothetical protein